MYFRHINYFYSSAAIMSDFQYTYSVRVCVLLLCCTQNFSCVFLLNIFLGTRVVFSNWKQKYNRKFVWIFNYQVVRCRVGKFLFFPRKHKPSRPAGEWNATKAFNEENQTANFRLLGENQTQPSSHLKKSKPRTLDFELVTKILWATHHPTTPPPTFKHEGGF